MKKMKNIALSELSYAMDDSAPKNELIKSKKTTLATKVQPERSWLAD